MLQQQQNIGSHQSVFKVEESLSKRYPYKEIPFSDRPQNQANDSFGYLGLKRNIDLLRDPSFPNEEKIKSLKLINNSLTNPDLKSRALNQFNIMDSFRHLFDPTFQNSITTVSHRILLNEWACKIIQSLASISTFKLTMKPIIYDLIIIVTGDVMKGSSAKMKHTTHYRDKIAAAMALHQFSMCHEGCRVLMSYDEERQDYNKVVDTLIYTIQNTTSESLSEWCIKTVSNLCEMNPTARDVASSLNVVTTIGNVLEMFEIYPVSLISNACMLSWNVALDGEGKKYSKELVPKLGRVVSFAVKHISNVDIEHLSENMSAVEELLNCVQYASGAMSSILVFEDSKTFTLNNVTAADSKDPPQTSVEILSKCLADIKDRSSVLHRIAFDYFPSYGPDIERNILSSIKFSSELPKARDAFSKELKAKSLFEFVYKDESHLFY